MKCLYINLDGAQARRENLEASFRRHAPKDWELVRIPASGPADVEDVPGSITLAEKACWRSHRTAIFTALVDDDDVLIVEDDTCFGPRTFEVIERVCATELPWDLCFTDVGLNVSSMMFYAARYGQLTGNGSVSVNDLSGMGFAAASGYLVRGGSKAKLVRLLDSPAKLDRPYDLQLQALTHAGRIRSSFCFPFVTQPSADAERSQIQPDAYRLRDLMHLAFRRLMNLDRDLDAVEPEVDRLETLHGERGAAMVGKVLGTIVSDAMRASAPGGGLAQGEAVINLQHSTLRDGTSGPI